MTIPSCLVHIAMKRILVCSCIKKSGDGSIPCWRQHAPWTSNPHTLRGSAERPAPILILQATWLFDDVSSATHKYSCLLNSSTSLDCKKKKHSPIPCLRSLEVIQILRHSLASLVQAFKTLVSQKRTWLCDHAGTRNNATV